jgi:glycosyltransferase involved in cell wall biosynthesis
LVTTEHSCTNRRRNNVLFYLLDKIVYSQYNKIISISDQTRINLEEYIGMKDKMVTIYNGVDLSNSKMLKMLKGIVTMLLFR